MNLDFSKFSRMDIFMALLSIMFLLRMNMSGKSFIDAIGVLIIMIWFFSSFFKTLKRI